MPPFTAELGPLMPAQSFLSMPVLWCSCTPPRYRWVCAGHPGLSRSHILGDADQSPPRGSRSNCKSVVVQGHGREGVIRPWTCGSEKMLACEEEET